MEFKIYEDEVFPYLMIDDFYNELEQELIWGELDSYILENSFTYGKGDGEAGVALDEYGNPIANLKRIYLDQIYTENRHASSILNFYTKIVSHIVISYYSKTTPTWITFKGSDNDLSQVSYYENGSEYKSHFDSFMHTALVWFYRKPKKFTGGDLKFNQSGQVVECKHNRMILFPSYYLHEVDKVVMDEKDLNKGLGRFCLTHFYNCDFPAWKMNQEI